MPKGRLRVATCQFAESFNPRRNAAMIRRYMLKAKRHRAELVHFHESCLTGYLAMEGAPSLHQYDWPLLREVTEDICREADRLKLWVVLGSAHPLSAPHKPTNCLYLISPDGEIHDRYDKRFCTGRDLDFYTPGDHFVTFRINGIKCSLLICYDLRFPELYRQLKKMGVEAIFQSFHNAYVEPGANIHTRIMRQTMQGHAGINYFWVSANNSSGYYSSYPSVCITPDGAIAQSLPQNTAGVMINTIDTTRQFYDASADFRELAMRGILHNGKPVRDARITNRKAL